MIRKTLRRVVPALALATVAAGTVASAAGAAVPSSLFGPDPRVPTSITAFAVPAGSLHLTATLTSAGGAPIAGATVKFTTGGSSVVMCTGTTDLTGLASCNISGAQRTQVRTLHGGVWFSNFAGNLTFQPTSRAGHL